MIFHEIYSAYYNAVAKILAALINEGSAEKDLQKIVAKYAFEENFVLPFSHSLSLNTSLIESQSGEYNQKFAGLRAMLGYMIMHPGKKLTFMGTEFAQFIEWDYQKQLDWFLLDYDMHRKFHDYVRELNGFYLKSSQLWQIEDSWDGFKWLLPDDSDRNILAFMRRNARGEALIVVCNFAPVKWDSVHIPVLSLGKYVPVFSSADVRFGGEVETIPSVMSTRLQNSEFKHKIITDVLPLSVTVYRRERKKTAEER